VLECYRFNVPKEKGTVISSEVFFVVGNIIAVVLLPWKFKD